MTAPDSASAAGEAIASPADSLSPLTPDGWGPLRIGMSRAEIVAAAGEDSKPDAVGGPDPEACDQFRPLDAPGRMLLMLEQGRLTRITLMSGSEVRTEPGFRVGDPATEVLERYGAAATTSPHKYAAAPAAYITIWRTPPPAADARGIRYEIAEDGRVSHIHAGGASIEYVEGCL